VALAKEGNTIFIKEIAEQNFSHSEKLHLFIDEALKQAGISYKELAAIALSKGPGSYTGLRIGASTAKGLCFALDIPLIALDSLQILALQVTHQGGLIIPMIDARRMEVYTATFDSNHNKISDTQALIIDENSFSQITQKIYFIGDGAEKCKPFLQRENLIFLDQIIYPSAQEMSLLSYEKFVAQEFEDIAYFEPFYLKEFFTGK